MASSSKKKRRRYPLLEWVSAAVGLAITLTLFGLLAIEAVRHRSEVPPRLSAAASGVSGGPGQYVVEVKVRNASHTTAASVTVEGALMEGDREVESSTATLAYVPGMSERAGGLIFTTDPRAYGLKVRATGYERP